MINHPLFRHKQNNPQAIHTRLAAFIGANRLTGSAKNKIILVFDGYPPAGGAGTFYGNTSVIFSRKINADEKIKRIVEESADRKNIVVVSDDKEIKFIVKSLGARQMGVEEFLTPEKKAPAGQEKEPGKDMLNYSQIETINKELGKLWLK